MKLIAIWGLLILVICYGVYKFNKMFKSWNEPADDDKNYLV